MFINSNIVQNELNLFEINKSLILKIGVEQKRGFNWINFKSLGYFLNFNLEKHYK